MKSNFRALLLAAGLGTRLRPLTLDIPKCLVPIGGEPLLGRWLRQLEAAGCKSVLVNTHYLTNQVVAFLSSWERTTMIVQSVNEPELLGTAGTLLTNLDFFEGETGLLIHADNVMAGDLKNLLALHEKRTFGCEITMLTFDTDTPQNCGIVTTDSRKVVMSFHEKVDHPPSNCANGAVYAMSPKFQNSLKKMSPKPRDFSNQVIPKLIRQIQTWHTHDAYLDIGTPKALAQAQQLFNKER